MSVQAELSGRIFRCLWEWSKTDKYQKTGYFFSSHFILRLGLYSGPLLPNALRYANLVILLWFESEIFPMFFHVLNAQFPACETDFKATEPLGQSVGGNRSLGVGFTHPWFWPKYCFLFATMRTSQHSSLQNHKWNYPTLTSLP